MPFLMFVCGAAVVEDADNSAFERELRSMPVPQEAPLADVLRRGVDLRLIL